MNPYTREGSTTTGWLDLHAHFSPPAPPEQARALWEAMRQDDFSLPEPYVWTEDGALEHMDRTGVAMQMLSQVPRVHGQELPAVIDRLRASNDHAAELVAGRPGRFGMLAALPTHDADAALAELERTDDLAPDGYLLTAPFAGVHLGDGRLEPVWAELDRRRAVVLVHPDAHAPGAQGRPSPLLEVAFDTARSVVDLLYAGVLRRHPGVTVVLAHAGGALPALAGRLQLLGAEPWVPNPHHLTGEEMREQLSRLYLDTAASGADSALAPAVGMVGSARLVYGSDSGTPCTSHRNVVDTVAGLRRSAVLDDRDVDALGGRGFDLFPAAARRVGRIGAGRAAAVTARTSLASPAP